MLSPRPQFDIHFHFQFIRCWRLHFPLLSFKRNNGNGILRPSAAFSAIHRPNLWRQSRPNWHRQQQRIYYRLPQLDILFGSLCVCVCQRVRVCMWLCACVCVLVVCGLFSHFRFPCVYLICEQHTTIKNYCLDLYAVLSKMALSHCYLFSSIKIILHSTLSRTHSDVANLIYFARTWSSDTKSH